jgi:hypothetical protein
MGKAADDRRTGRPGLGLNTRNGRLTVHRTCEVSAKGRSAIMVRAALSSMGKKSSGPGLLSPDVITAATTNPLMPPAADIALSVFARALGLARKK